MLKAAFVEERWAGGENSGPPRLLLSKIVRALIAISACFLSVVSFGAGQPNPKELAVRELLVRTIAEEAPEQRRNLLIDLGETGATLVRDVLTAWTRDGLYYYEAPNGSKAPVLLEEQQDAEGKARAVRVDTGQAVKDAAGAEARFSSSDLTSIDTDAQLRGQIQQTLDTLALSDPDPDARRSAVLKLGNSGKAKYESVLLGRLEKERDRSVQKSIREALAILKLLSGGETNQVAAIEELGRLHAMGSLDLLKRVAANPQTNPTTLHATSRAISLIESHMAWINFFGTLFRGVSLGSILLVVALGLAITFGLMGVINMAHGEMIAIGAYACYVVQNVFGAGFAFSITLPFYFNGQPIGFSLRLPGLNATGLWYESYFLFALPLSFLTAALAGLVLERSVIRFLYRRPLESLLATWGVSLVMQQCFRIVFGANNVQVNSPSWLLGHFSIGGVSFGYNRVFVVAFAIIIVFGTWIILSKTPLGLLIRAVMQNRNMAACMGVGAGRVNMLTFAFGSGLAGLAGAFLSQIGNVGPGLGQIYIVDSFMTVVVGGVGSIVGTVYSALGIGTADQILQQVTGSPVTGKIVVLITIIVFLQWKPGGLFATRSRTLD